MPNISNFSFLAKFPTFLLLFLCLEFLIINDISYLYYSAKRHSQQPKGIESEISYWDNNLEEEEEENYNEEENSGGDEIEYKDRDGDGERGEDTVESRDGFRNRINGVGHCDGEEEVRMSEEDRRKQGDALNLVDIEGRYPSNIPQEHSHNGNSRKQISCSPCSSSVMLLSSSSNSCTSTSSKSLLRSSMAASEDGERIQVPREGQSQVRQVVSSQGCSRVFIVKGNPKYNI